MATQGVSKAIGAISRVFGGGARAAAPVSRAVAPRAAARAAPRASQAARVRPASIRYGANALRYTGRTGFSSRQHLTNIRTKAWEFERRRRLQAKALQRLLNKRATTIQKVQRGNLSRSRVQALLQQRALANHQLATNAATKLQAAWRGKVAHHRYFIKQRDFRNFPTSAARTLQSRFRSRVRPQPFAALPRLHGTYPSVPSGFARTRFSRPLPSTLSRYTPPTKGPVNWAHSRNFQNWYKNTYGNAGFSRPYGRVPSARFSTRPSATYPTNIPGYAPQAAKAGRIERYGVPAATAASLGGAVGTAIYGGPLVPWGPDNDIFQALQNIRIPDVLQEYGTEKARDLREWYRNREKSQKTRKQQPRKQQPEKKKENKQEKKRDEAARTIQRAYRAYVSRKRPSRLLLDFNDYERKRRRLY
jgi:hypothetical protein